jgi:tetratricopeptide (TPR) repeat protein
VISNKTRAQTRARSLTKVLQYLGSVALLSALIPTSGPAAEDNLAPDQAAAYADCMALARSEPDAAWERANVWLSEGGGNAAEHCAAVALFGLGQYLAAGERLEALAAHLRKAFAPLQTEILAQAAQAWLLAGDNERAYDVQSAALLKAPDDVELLVDRSMTMAIVGNFEAALADLDKAHKLAPQRADVLVFRSSAKRFLDAPEAAREDIDRALVLEPGNPEALLERGILHRLAGDDAAARSDWLEVTIIAEGTPTAAAAQNNLEKLDVTP